MLRQIGVCVAGPWKRHHMAIRPAHIPMKSIATLGALAAALLLGACAESGDSLEASLVAPKGKDQQTASASDAKPERSELE